MGHLLRDSVIENRILASIYCDSNKADLLSGGKEKLVLADKNQKPSNHCSSGFHRHMADAADQVVGGGFAFGHGDTFDGRRLMVGTENEMGSGQFHVSDRTSIVFQNSVHIELAFAIRRK